jgi:nucleoside-diphosphate-sugar epimerase
LRIGGEIFVRVLLTGAGGYVGAYTAKYLCEQGAEVIGVTSRVPQSSIWKSHLKQIIEADISTDAGFAKLTGLSGIDAILHTVSLNHTDSEKNSSQSLLVNLNPTLRLLELASKIGAKTFLYLSTQQVYGRNGKGDVTEMTPPCPENKYGLTHLLSENCLEVFERRGDLRCVSLRLSNGYGIPTLQNANAWSLVVNDLCQMAVNRRELRLTGDGSAQRDFIHIQDITRAIHHALGHSELRGVFNLGSGETTSILDLAKLVSTTYQKVSGNLLPIFLGDGSRVDGKRVTKSPIRFQYRVEKMARSGFRSSINLEQGVMDFIQELLSAEKAKAA